MIYLDSGATSFRKPACVHGAVVRAMRSCASPGRGGYGAARCAQQELFDCREQAAKMFDCQPEQVVFTTNATHGLNIAIRTLVNPMDRVVISGFEHNAVVRPLYGIGANVEVAGRKLFDPHDTLDAFERALRRGAKAAVFTHCSNVFGYVLPVEELGRLCKQYGVPFIVDAAQSAGVLPVELQKWGADFIAMPGHKGLLGPQGTGLLLCNRLPKPLLMGGTGSYSQSRSMPDFLPDMLEAGTANVPGIAGLCAGIKYISRQGLDTIGHKKKRQCVRCASGLEKLGMKVFCGEDQNTAVSFVPKIDCQEFADLLWKRKVAVRAGLHCAPIAHESAGTLESGTVRVSFGMDCCDEQTDRFLQLVENCKNAM